MTVRFIPNADPARQLALLRRLESIGYSDLVEIPAGQPLSDVVKQQCGFVTKDLLDIVRRANPHVNAGPSTELRRIQFPPCPYWKFGTSVKISKDENLDDVLRWSAGISGPDTIQSVIKKNYNVVDPSGTVKAGTIVQLPFTTKSVSFYLRPAYARNATITLASLARDFPDFTKAGLGARYFSNAPTEFRMVPVIRPATVPGRTECIPGSAPSPFDVPALLETLRRNAAQGAVSQRGVATVVIADSGIEESDTRFLPGFGGNPKATLLGANMDGTAGFPGVISGFEHPDHGVQVAGAALAGLTDSQLTKWLAGKVQVAIAGVVSSFTYQEQSGPNKGKPFSKYSITPSNVEASVMYAKKFGLPILNWSFESETGFDPLDQLLRDTPNFLVVAAAGNDHVPLNRGCPAGC